MATKACERRGKGAWSSGEGKGFGPRAGRALVCGMCRAWAPAPLTSPREGTFTVKVRTSPGPGERGEHDGRVDEQAYLIIPVQPSFTVQRLVSTTSCRPCAQMSSQKHGEGSQQGTGRRGERLPCTRSAIGITTPDAQAAGATGLLTLSSAAARKAARGPFAIALAFYFLG